MSWSAGTRYLEGLLVIIDGGKGLYAAVKKAFRKRALVQRCSGTNAKTVVSHLSKSEQVAWRQRLQRAYNCPEYKEAFVALEQLHRELEERNQTAAGSWEDGLDETLTPHRLGAYGVLGRSRRRTALNPSTFSSRNAARRSTIGRTRANASAGWQRRSWTSNRA